MSEQGLTRLQVEQILVRIELALTQLCGSDGVDTADLLRHDAQQRARLQGSVDAYYALSGFYDKLQAELDQVRLERDALNEWKTIILGTGTDQEAVIRLAAVEYTKIIVGSWKRQVADLTRKLAKKGKP